MQSGRGQSLVRAALVTIVFAITIRIGAAFAERQIDVQATGYLVPQKLTASLDGGTIASFQDYSVSVLDEGRGMRFYGTFAPWKPESYDHWIYKADALGLELSLFGIGSVNESGFQLSFLAGAYSALRWNQELADFYLIPRGYLGAKASLGKEKLSGLVGYNYYTNFRKKGETKVDDVTISNAPGDFWELRTEARYEIFEKNGVWLKLGTFQLSETEIFSGLATFILDPGDLNFFSFGITGNPIPEILFIDVGLNNVFSSFTKRGVELATGRRALAESVDGLMLTITGKIK